MSRWEYKNKYSKHENNDICITEGGMCWTMPRMGPQNCFTYQYPWSHWYPFLIKLHSYLLHSTTPLQDFSTIPFFDLYISPFYVQSSTEPTPLFLLHPTLVYYIFLIVLLTYIFVVIVDKYSLSQVRMKDCIIIEYRPIIDKYIERTKENRNTTIGQEVIARSAYIYFRPFIYINTVLRKPKKI